MGGPVKLFLEVAHAEGNTEEIVGVARPRQPSAERREGAESERGK